VSSNQKIIVQPDIKSGAHRSVPQREHFAIIPFLRLLRWPNLLIIFFTQAAVWWCVIQPLGEGSLVLDRYHFLFLTASTVAIAAAGYLINDYFDIRIDAVNHPEKFILEKKIHRRIAIILHSALNALGLLLALIVARRSGSLWPVLVPIVCTTLLWFYSTHFKQRFMVGNVVVAILTALAVLILLFYEPALLRLFPSPALTSDLDTRTIVNPAYIVAGYAYFAFVLTWMREIVKDMEDIRGDSAERCDTMPIRWGLLRSCRFTQVLGILAVAPLLYGALRLVLAGTQTLPLGLYLFAAVTIPLSVWTLRLTAKATTKHYSRASRGLKIIMVLGVGFLFLYRYGYA
jgi:4-hydroxybenzoate polyprenyltransferase